MLHSQLVSNDLHSPTNEQIENDTISAIAALIAVTYNGIGASYPSIVPANGATDRVRGVTQTIIEPSGGTGYISSLGFMIGNATTPVNTSPWTEGTQLYASSIGVLQTTPNGSVIATVYKQDSINGVMYIENSYQSGGGGSGNVTGPSSSTNEAIATWNGTTGTVLQDNPMTAIQPSGAIQAQAIIYDRQILADVTIPDNYTMICNDIELISGDIILEGSATLLLL